MNENQCKWEEPFYKAKKLVESSECLIQFNICISEERPLVLLLHSWCLTLWVLFLLLLLYRWQVSVIVTVDPTKLETLKTTSSLFWMQWEPEIVEYEDDFWTKVMILSIPREFCSVHQTSSRHQWFLSFIVYMYQYNEDDFFVKVFIVNKLFSNYKFTSN